MLLRDMCPCVVKKNHTAVQMACFVWRKDRDLVSTASFDHIADRIRPRESSFHTWDRPTRTPFSYDTGA
jgi:hypothetical protein